ncbi:MAG: hypothetical protein EAZ92_06665 [Candidatus Kapaibacterium sp.]|nr:MAG: hypothetical protein EAZ92_06665 [Candidatus Kapabacteria bacterium]
MKKYAFLFCFFAVFVCLGTRQVLAQEETDKINIYGIATADYRVFGANKDAAIGSGAVSNTFNAQFNLFVSGNIGSEWKYLAELYIQNDFRFQQGINSSSDYTQPLMHQLWIEWRPTDAFGLRFGQILLPFASFNNIHSRPNLYWFIERPFPYEEPATTDGIGEVRAEFGNLSASGVVRLGDGLKLDYVGYVGNTDRRILNGFDLSATKTFGTRIALRTDNITLGLSAATNLIGNKDSVAQTNLTLLAGDIKGEFGNLNLIGEFIQAFENFEAIPGKTGFNIRNYQSGVVNQFAYLSLGYNFSEQWLAFAGFDFYRTNERGARFENNAALRATGGLNFRPADKVIVKAQGSYHLAAGAENPAYLSAALGCVVSF